jgi:hypothetical protein
MNTFLKFTLSIILFWGFPFAVFSQVIFEDNFDGDSLNLESWNPGIMKKAMVAPIYADGAIMNSRSTVGIM